jgi:hypothetical protein
MGLIGSTKSSQSLPKAATMKLNPMFHEARDEVHVPRQTIKPRDNQGALLGLRLPKSCGKPRAEQLSNVLIVAAALTVGRTTTVASIDSGVSPGSMTICSGWLFKCGGVSGSRNSPERAAAPREGPTGRGRGCCLPTRHSPCTRRPAETRVTGATALPVARILPPKEKDASFIWRSGLRA